MGQDQTCILTRSSVPGCQGENGLWRRRGGGGEASEEATATVLARDGGAGLELEVAQGEECRILDLF